MDFQIAFRGDLADIAARHFALAELQWQGDAELARGADAVARALAAVVDDPLLAYGRALPHPATPIRHQRWIDRDDATNERVMVRFPALCEAHDRLAAGLLAWPDAELAGGETPLGDGVELPPPLEAGRWYRRGDDHVQARLRLAPTTVPSLQVLVALAPRIAPLAPPACLGIGLYSYPLVHAWDDLPPLRLGPFADSATAVAAADRLIAADGDGDGDSVLCDQPAPEPPAAWIETARRLWTQPRSHHRQLATAAFLAEHAAAFRLAP